MEVSWSISERHIYLSSCWTHLFPNEYQVNSKYLEPNNFRKLPDSQEVKKSEYNIMENSKLVRKRKILGKRSNSLTVKDQKLLKHKLKKKMSDGKLELANDF